MFLLQKMKFQKFWRKKNYRGHEPLKCSTGFIFAMFKSLGCMPIFLSFSLSAHWEYCLCFKFSTSFLFLCFHFSTSFLFLFFSFTAGFLFLIFQLPSWLPIFNVSASQPGSYYSCFSFSTCFLFFYVLASQMASYF